MNFSFPKNYWSLLVSLAIITYLFSWPFYNYWLNPFTWDTFGYYLYLPMLFIYNDLGISDFSILENLKQEQFISPTFYQINKTETGNWLIRYPMGLAILHSPFFGLGHIFSKLYGYSQNGFSIPYQIAITLGSISYISSSFLILRKILLKWFNDFVVAITVFIIFFGTNLISQATVSATMPHSIIFFIYCLIILFTTRWHNDKNFFNSIFLGLTIGIAIISRPTEVVSVLIPILWQVKNWKDLKSKAYNIWTNNRKHLFVSILSCSTVVLLLLIYWKIYTGYFIYNSYNNIGEGLDLLSPHTLNFLFSFKKGWFIYTPIMVFSVIGFLYLKKYKPDYFLSFFCFFLLNLYLVSSWTCWWYAASFGQRALVQSYVVMSIPLAFFIKNIGVWKNNFYKILISTTIVLLVSLNLFQNYQFRLGIIHGHRMTSDYYFATFGRLDVDVNNFENLLSFDRSLTFEESIKKHNYSKKEIYRNSFEADDNLVSSDFKLEGDKSLIVNKEAVFSKSFSLPYRKITTKEYCWIEIKFWAYITNKNSNINLVNTIVRSGKNYGYSAYNIVLDKDSLILNKWQEHTVYYQTPHIRNKNDEFKSYFWYCGGQRVYIDNLIISKYVPKQ